MILCDIDVLIEFYKNTAHILQELHTIGQSHLVVRYTLNAKHFQFIPEIELYHPVTY